MEADINNHFDNVLIAAAMILLGKSLDARRLACLLCCCLYCVGVAAQNAVPNAVLITNVMIVDGTGSLARRGAVRIRGDRIVDVGELAFRDDDTVVDGFDQVLAPGFIDTHSHHDTSLPAARDVVALTSQGVTTMIVGQDGLSQTPLAAFYGKLLVEPIAVNLGSFSGHNTLRALTMSSDPWRAADDKEIAKMADLLEQDLAAGAFGLSTGLMHESGAFSTPAEVQALAKIAARRGGRYATHLRNEGFELVNALQEAIDVGRRIRMPVQVSHLKIDAKREWGQSERILKLLDEARADGVEITADVYPYTFWQGTMRLMFPVNDPEDSDGLAFMFTESTPPGKLRVLRFAPDPSVENKTIEELSWTRGREPVALYIDMMRQVAAYERTYPEQGSAETIIGESMSEDDVTRFLQWPHANIGSDGFPAGHPRGHGTFTRILGHYVRERGVLTLEQAVSKMTALAAQNLGIDDRGVIRPGAYADLVLFDPDAVSDRASLDDPTALSAGIAKVWVNGEIVFEAGKATQRRPGSVLRRAP